MSPIISTLANGSAYGYRTLAAAGGPAYESIASATGTGSSGTITFSSIPSTYTSLQIRYNAIQTGAGGQALRMQVNSDTGSNYARHLFRGNGTGTVQSIGSASSTFISLSANGVGLDTVYPSSGIIDIQDYASTTRYKTVRDFGGKDNNTTSSGVNLNSGLWMNTAAITSISLLIPADSFTTDTTVSLYGIKGA
jgi:hypothetical protein